MLPLAQHQPCAVAHPLVAPWAKRQETPSALHHLEAARASERRERPWLVKPPALTGVLLLSSADAQRRERQKARKLSQARADVRRLENELSKLVGSAVGVEEHAALESELEVARAAATGKAAKAPRRERRAALKAVPKSQRREIWAQHAALGPGYFQSASTVNLPTSVGGVP